MLFKAHRNPRRGERLEQVKNESNPLNPPRGPHKENPGPLASPGKKTEKQNQMPMPIPMPMPMPTPNQS